MGMGAIKSLSIVETSRVFEVKTHVDTQKHSIGICLPTLSEAGSRNSFLEARLTLNGRASCLDASPKFVRLHVSPG
jgi:hypothetical protein